MPAEPPTDTDHAHGAFASLVAQTNRDAAALQGLALAYVDLRPDDRRRLIQAVVNESPESSDVLAAFLAVESSVELAEVLARELAERTPHDAIRLKRRARMRGNAARGEAHLMQPLHGPFVEVLHVVWDKGVVSHVSLEPMTHLDDVSELQEVSPEPAIDTLAPLLWRYRQHGGQLPQGAARFADWFSAPEPSLVAGGPVSTK